MSTGDVPLKERQENMKAAELFDMGMKMYEAAGFNREDVRWGVGEWACGSEGMSEAAARKELEGLIQQDIENKKAESYNTPGNPHESGEDIEV